MERRLAVNILAISLVCAAAALYCLLESVDYGRVPAFHVAFDRPLLSEQEANALLLSKLNSLLPDATDAGRDRIAVAIKHLRPSSPLWLPSPLWARDRLAGLQRLARGYGLRDHPNFGFDSNFALLRRRDPIDSAIRTQAFPARAILEGTSLMEVGRPYTIRLAIERGLGEALDVMAFATPIPTLRDERVMISTHAAATAVSPLLGISPVEPEWKALRTGAETEFRWRAVPEEPGKDVLTVTLLQRVSIGEVHVDVPVQSYPQQIEVTASSWAGLFWLGNAIRTAAGNLTETIAASTALLTSCLALIASLKALRAGRSPRSAQPRV